MSRMHVRRAHPPHGKHSAVGGKEKVLVSATTHGKLWWFIFGELLRFREHVFPDAHVNSYVRGVHRYAWYAHTHTQSPDGGVSGIARMPQRSSNQGHSPFTSGCAHTAL